MKIPIVVNALMFTSKTYKSTNNDPKMPAYPNGNIFDGFSKNTAEILVIWAKKATNAMKMMESMVLKISPIEYISGGGPAAVAM